MIGKAVEINEGVEISGFFRAFKCCKTYQNVAYFCHVFDDPAMLSSTLSVANKGDKAIQCITLIGLVYMVVYIERRLYITMA